MVIIRCILVINKMHNYFHVVWLEEIIYVVKLISMYDIYCIMYQLFKKQKVRLFPFTYLNSCILMRHTMHVFMFEYTLDKIKKAIKEFTFSLKLKDNK
jgi:hypothetical protein